MTTTPLPQWATDAAAILRAAITRQDNPTPEEMTTTYAARHGNDMVVTAMWSWIDTTAHRAGVPRAGEDADFAVSPMALDPDTGRPVPIDDAPPAVAWAMRLVVARFTMDRDQAEALIRTVTTDEEWSERVGHVLLVCAGIIRGDQGFVRKVPARPGAAFGLS